VNREEIYCRGTFVCVKEAVDGEKLIYPAGSVAAADKRRCVKGTLGVKGKLDVGSTRGDLVKLAVRQLYGIFDTRRADRSQQRGAIKLRNLPLIAPSVISVEDCFKGSLCDPLSLYHRNFWQQTAH
jgi:hypothetical protein